MLGHGRGQVQRRGDGDVVLDHRLSGLGELAVAAGLPGQVHHHAAGLHRFHRRGGHQTRRGPARDQRGGDHHVESADRFFQRLLLLGTFVFGELAGVPALTGSVDSDVQPLRPHRTHLVGDLGTHVVAGGARAQPFGRRQRLQPGHADARAPARWPASRCPRPSSASGRTESTPRPRAARPCSRRRWPATTARPSPVPARCAGWPPARTPAHRLLERADRVVGVARRQKADQRLPAAQPADLVGGRRRDLDDDVGGPRIADGGAGRRVELVGQQRALARAGLDHDRHPTIHQRRDRFGYQRDAPLVGPGFGDHPDRSVCGSVMARTSTFLSYLFQGFLSLPLYPIGVNTLAGRYRAELPKHDVLAVFGRRPGAEVAALGFVDRHVVDAGLAARHQARRRRIPTVRCRSCGTTGRSGRGTRTETARRCGCRGSPTSSCAANNPARAATCGSGTPRSRPGRRCVRCGFAMRVERVGPADAFGVAGVPGILGGLDLLQGCFVG